MTGEPTGSRTGLLLAMMEPPPSMAEEFQDWYDTEHFPERAGTEGFVTAQRLVCVQGWPRYLALYDLSSLAVLDGPGYAAIARNRYSQWTKRIIPRMWGHYRAEAEQIHPGAALLGAKGKPARLALWLFRNAPTDAGGAIVEAVRASFVGAPNLLQWRVFQSPGTESCDYIATVELADDGPVPSVKVAAFGDVVRHLEVTNLYTPYWR
jgi:hypothetical protein